VSGVTKLSRVVVDNLLSQSEKNRNDDSGFERLTKDDEENGNGEEILRHPGDGTRKTLGDLGHRDPIHFGRP